MPNLLFLFTDEQRADSLATYGNQRIQMPNLDQLASEGIVFDQPYVTQPVCTPSRSSILTGLWPHTNGCTANNLRLRPDTPCFPEMLPAGKYATAYHGKWHLGDEIYAQHGFDEWRSIEDMYRGHFAPDRDQDDRSSYHHFLVEEGFSPEDGNVFGRHQATRLPEAFGKPAYLAAEASRFIREHVEHPFVLFVNFLEPHMPFFGPRDDQYDPMEVDLPANFDALPSEDQPLKTRLLQKAYFEKGHSGFPLRTEGDWRRLIANYSASTTTPSSSTPRTTGT
jgi:arylsulfatase A-like enzyme